MIRPVAVLCALLPALFAVGGCTAPGNGEAGPDTLAPVELPVVEGVLVWSEHMILPPPAVARVRLLRLGGPDVAPAVLAEAIMRGPLASPSPFLLPYRPPLGPPPDRGYGIAAMITVFGEVAFASSVPTPLSRLPPDPSETPVVVPLTGTFGTVVVDLAR